MEIIIEGRYAHCSRGYTTARHQDGAWAPRENGNVIINEAGRWHLSTTDGFNRRRSCDIRVQEDGTITGISSDFDLVA